MTMLQGLFQAQCAAQYPHTYNFDGSKAVPDQKPGAKAGAVADHQAAVAQLIASQGITEYDEEDGLSSGFSSSVDQYRIALFKVLACRKKYNHDWTACPYAHPGERARRRCLLVHDYHAKVCPDIQNKGECPRGEECTMTHSMFEYWMHPQRYRTKLCREGQKCTRTFCFFAHSPDQLRVAVYTPAGLPSPAAGSDITEPFLVPLSSSSQQLQPAKCSNGHSSYDQQQQQEQQQQQQMLLCLQGDIACTPLQGSSSSPASSSSMVQLQSVTSGMNAAAAAAAAAAGTGLLACSPAGISPCNSGSLSWEQPGTGANAALSTGMISTSNHLDAAAVMYNHQQQQMQQQMQQQYQPLQAMQLVGPTQDLAAQLQLMGLGAAQGMSQLDSRQAAAGPGTAPMMTYMVPHSSGNVSQPWLAPAQLPAQAAPALPAVTGPIAAYGSSFELLQGNPAAVQQQQQLMQLPLTGQYGYAGAGMNPAPWRQGFQAVVQQ